MWLGPGAGSLLVSTALGAGAKEGSTGSFTPTQGQTQTQQAEEVALREVRPGLEEMEMNPEGTPNNPGPLLFLRKLGCSCLVTEVGETWMSEVNLHRESPSPKRRDSGSLEQNKLFGRRHRSRRAVQ